MQVARNRPRLRCAGPARRRGALRPGYAGFTYLGVLFLVTLTGLGLTALASLWSSASIRDKEAELLFVGQQFERAIASYVEQAPGGVKEFPRSLDELLEDPRWPGVRRHLRKIYVDPMTGQREWGLIVQGDRIAGVHSLSQAKPRKRAGFDKRFEEFAQAQDYTQWRFTYRPAHATGQQTGATAAAAPAAATATPPSPGAGVVPAEGPAQAQECARVHEIERRSCENRFRLPGSRAREDCLQRAQARFGSCASG